MSRNSKTLKWFVAEIIVEIKVGKQPNNVVHTNTLLIEAVNAEEAYRKSIKLGEAENSEYKNPKGEIVTSKFRGLRDINQVHEDLEHGTELFYEEDIDIPEKKILSWATSKDELTIFRKSQKPKNMPDYSDGEIAQAYDKYLKENQ